MFGGDPFPYGIEPNRPTLNALVHYLHEQALILSQSQLDDLFAPVHGVSWIAAVTLRSAVLLVAGQRDRRLAPAQARGCSEIIRRARCA